MKHKHAAFNLLITTVFASVNSQNIDTSYIKDLAPDNPPVCSENTPFSSNTKTPAKLRIYIADLPDKYSFDIIKQWQGQKEHIDWHRPWGYVHGADDNHAFRTNDAYSPDFWFYVQLLQSPLRVHCIHDADVVFIPAFFLNPRATNTTALQTLANDFFSQLPSLFPHISKLPHILGYSRPIAQLLQLVSQQQPPLQLPEKLWVLSTSQTAPSDQPIQGTNSGSQYGATGEPYTSSIEDAGKADSGKTGSTDVVKGLQSRVITVPTSSWVHFSRGSREYREGFNAAAANKSRLAVQVFSGSESIGWQLQAQCDEAAGDCLQLPSVDEMNIDSVYTAWDAYHESWYCVIVGTEDEPVDRSMVDCILGGSIPVITNAEMVPLLPFADIIDWGRLTVVLDHKKGPGTLLEQLKEYHKQEGEAGAIQLLRQLYALKPILQYSLNPVHDLARVDRRDTMVHEEDGLTATLKAIMRMLCKQGGMPGERCRRVANYQRKSRTAMTLPPTN